MKKRLLATLLAGVLALSTLGLMACGNDAADPPADPAAEETVDEADDEDDAPAADAEDRDWVIAVMPKLIGIPYFNASEVGALQAGEDFGVTVLYVGPTAADATEQVRMLEDLIIQGVDAIAVAPNDPDALSPVLQSARDAGIVVLDWDTPANPEDVVYSIHQVDLEDFARLYFDLMVQEVGSEEFDFAIITGGLNAANLNGWIDAGLAYAAERYPGLNLVTDRIPTDESQQLAYERTLELLTAHPDIRAILGYSTPVPLGVAMALRERGLVGEIVNIGSTTPNDSVEFLEDGSLTMGLLWDPALLGYLTVWAAIEVLEGRSIQDGYNVPGVGPITVNGQVVVMGPPSIWTNENVRNYDF